MTNEENKIDWENAVIYVRVSSMEQVNNWNWLDSQETACQKYCFSKNLYVIKTFRDWWASWKDTNRKWLQDMLQFIQEMNKTSEKIKFIVVDDIDRLSRDLKDFLELMQLFKNLEVQILSLKQILTDTPEWELLTHITMAMKNYERTNNARRTKVRMMSRLQNWYRTFLTPHWYEYIKDPTWPWSIVIKNQDADVIWEAIKQYADYRDFSLYDVRNYLNDRWIKSRRSQKLYWSFIERLFERERLFFYAWYIDVPNFWIIMQKWKHESIIDLEVVDKVLKKKELRSKQFYKQYSKVDIMENLILRWYLTCPYCQSKVTWWAVKGRNKYYFYYWCTNWCAYWPSKIKVDNALRNKLKKLSIDKNIIEIFWEMMYDKVKNDWNYMLGKLEERKTELEKLETDIKKLTKKIVVIDDMDLIMLFKDELKESRLKYGILKEEISKWEIETKNVWVNYDELINKIKNIFSNVDELYETLSVDLKRKFINLFLWDTIYYDVENDEIKTPKLNPVFNLFSLKSNPMNYTDLMNIKTSVDMISKEINRDKIISD